MRNTKLILNFIAAVAIIFFGLYLAIKRAASPLEQRVEAIEYITAESDSITIVFPGDMKRFSKADSIIFDSAVSTEGDSVEIVMQIRKKK